MGRAARVECAAGLGQPQRHTMPIKHCDQLTELIPAEGTFVLTNHDRVEPHGPNQQARPAAPRRAAGRSTPRDENT